MAQYWEDWSGSSLGANPPTGWSEIWNTSQSFAVESDVRAPGGKRVAIAPSGSPTRSGLKWDAIDADANRATLDMIALIEVTEAGATSATTYGGLLGRASGSASSETGVTGSVGNRSGSGTEDLRSSQYSGGTLSTFYDDVTDTWVIDTLYWLRLQLSGTTVTVSLYAEGDPLGTPIASFSDTISVTGAGGVGLFAFATTGTIRYLCVGVGTNGDAPPTSNPDSTAPVLSSPTGTQTGSTSASGTVSTDEGNGTLYYYASTNSTEDIATVKASGSSQAVSSTGVQNVTFSGLSAGTTYYAHYVHTDAAGNDSSRVSSSSFTTPSTAVKGVVVRLYDGATAQASVTGLTALWYDEIQPHLWGAPDQASNTESTDANGDIVLDIDATTALNIGDYGFLLVYKADGSDVKDSLAFMGQVQVVDIS